MEGEEGKNGQRGGSPGHPEDPGTRSLFRFKDRSTGKTASSPPSLHYQPASTRRLSKTFLPCQKDHVDCPEVIRGCGPGSPRHGWVDYLYEDRLCQGIDGGHSTGQ